MQDSEHNIKIASFLRVALPVVADVVRTFLQAFDWEVQEEGRGLDSAFAIKFGEKEIKFFMHNLLLEIATVDRDENPLKFDEKLHDAGYFLTKTTRLVGGRLWILLQLVSQDDVEAAIEKLSRKAGQYERIRIWRFDDKGPASAPGH